MRINFEQSDVPASQHQGRATRAIGIGGMGAPAEHAVDDVAAKDVDIVTLQNQAA